MKIGFIINGLAGGGAEKALIVFLSYLHKYTDHKIFLVCLEKSTPAFALPPGIKPHVLHTGALNRGPGRLASIPAQSLELALLFKKHKVDISMSYLVRSNAINALSGKLGNPGKIVLSEHFNADMHYAEDAIQDKFMRNLILRTYPLADQVIAVSGGVKNGLVDLGLSPSSISVIFNPVECSLRQEDSILKRRKVKNKPPIITTTGRLIELKDHRTLFKAFSLLLPRTKATLQILGVGPLQEELQKYAEELGIEKQVTFLGWKTDPQSILIDSDLFVLSSRWEGFGIVIVEAMACGLPVVSTNCPTGPAEILGDGEWGLLVPVADYQALADAMYTLLVDKELAKKLSIKGIKRAQDFDVQVIGKELEEALLSLL